MASNSKKDKLAKAARNQLNKKGNKPAAPMSELMSDIKQDQVERKDQGEPVAEKPPETAAPPSKPEFVGTIVEVEKSAEGGTAPESPENLPDPEDSQNNQNKPEEEVGADNILISGEPQATENGPESSKIESRIDSESIEDSTKEPAKDSTIDLIKDSGDIKKENRSENRPDIEERVSKTPAESDARDFMSEKEKMAKTRDSIYNVSSDIRLEDYTESNEGKGGAMGTILKLIAGLLILALLYWGATSFMGIFFAPNYQLAVSSSPIQASNIEQYVVDTPVAPGAGNPVYIMFRWGEGDLTATYVDIKVESDANGTFQKVVNKGRTPPRTANYIYLTTLLAPGKYRLQVSDQDGTLLKERSIVVE